MKRKLILLLASLILLTACSGTVIEPTQPIEITATIAIPATSTAAPSPTAEPTPTADPLAQYEYADKFELSQDFMGGGVTALTDENGNLVTLVQNGGEITPNEAGLYFDNGKYYAWNADEGKMMPLFEAAKMQEDTQSGWLTFLGENDQVVGVFDPQTGKTYTVNENGQLTIDNVTLEWRDGVWVEMQSNLELLSSKIENAITREYVIKNGNEVWKNGKLHARLKPGEDTELKYHFTFPWKYLYQGARYLGNQFAVDWQDSEMGKVKIYGFEAAFYNPENNEWAAVPVLFMSNPPEVQASGYRKNHGTKYYFESTEKAQRRLTFGEILEMQFQAEDNSKRFSQENLNCYEGWCNYADFILARAFGTQMCPTELIDWVKGVVRVRPSEPVFIQDLVQYE